MLSAPLQHHHLHCRGVVTFLSAPLQQHHERTSRGTGERAKYSAALSPPALRQLPVLLGAPPPPPPALEEQEQGPHLRCALRLCRGHSTKGNRQKSKQRRCLPAFIYICQMHVAFEGPSKKIDEEPTIPKTCNFQGGAIYADSAQVTSVQTTAVSNAPGHCAGSAFIHRCHDSFYHNASTANCDQCLAGKYKNFALNVKPGCPCMHRLSGGTVSILYTHYVLYL
jgi:hypothetical protein